MTEETPVQDAIRAGCYLRISSDPDDKRQGVARQRQDTTTLCEVKGWTAARFYEDNDRSASNGRHRPAWDRLLADIKAGEIDAIAAWDQDRGWRMMRELEQLRTFFTGLGRRIPLATTGQGDIDLYTPTGVMMAQVKTAVSEHEIAMMKVRQKRAGRQRAEQGRPKWKTAFGYLPDTRRKQDDDGTREPDPTVAALVVKAYRAIVAGASLKDVAAMWNEAGAYGRTGKPWNESLVGQFLRKPRNAGLRDYNGVIIGKGTWTALVDEPLWQAAQAALDRRPAGGRGIRRAYREHLLTGVVDCGKCGAAVSGGRDIRGAVRYACSGCRGVSVRGADLEPYLIEFVGRRLARPDAADLLKTVQSDAAEAQKIRDQKAALYAQIDALALERAEGLLTGRQVQIATEAVQNKIAVLERAEQDQERLRVFDGIPLGTDDAIEAVENLSANRFRAVAKLLMTATLMPVGKGSHQFLPERVRVEPV